MTVSIQVIQCIECAYEIIAQDLSSTHFLNVTLNTAYTYRIRIDSTSASSCEQTLSLREHGRYTFDVQLSTTNSTLECHLTTENSGNNIYIPFIIAGIILLILFIVCLVAQRLKWLERLIRLKNDYLRSRSTSESGHAYNLDARSEGTNVVNINATEASPVIAKSESVQKTPNAVPRSKRLLSLDGFRGLSRIN